MSHRHPGAGRCLRAFVWSAGILLLVAACADRQTEQAREAIAEIEAAVTAAGTEPAEFVPKVLDDVNDRLDVLKTRFEQKDYAGVLADAPAALAAARNLPAEAAARKAELQALLQQEWTGLSGAIPQQIETVRAKVERIAAQKKIPRGITVATLDTARQGVDDARALWERAIAEHDASRPEQAVTLGNQARDRIEGVAAALGTTSPVAVK